MKQIENCEKRFFPLSFYIQGNYKTKLGFHTVFMLHDTYISGSI